MTSLEIATLAIAIVGAVTGTVALVWNILQFWLAGPRVRVSISAAMLSTELGTALSGPPEVWLRPIDGRHKKRVIEITARNIGRFPTTVLKYQVDVGKGFAFSYVQSLYGPSIPHQLDAHGEPATWYLEFDATAALRQVAVESQMETKTQPLRASVVLADGRRVVSENTLEIPSELMRKTNGDGQ